jgi:hypothetical protein
MPSGWASSARPGPVAAVIRMAHGAPLDVVRADRRVAVGRRGTGAPGVSPTPPEAPRRCAAKSRIETHRRPPRVSLSWLHWSPVGRSGGTRGRPLPAPCAAAGSTGAAPITIAPRVRSRTASFCAATALTGSSTARRPEPAQPRGDVPAGGAESIRTPGGPAVVPPGLPQPTERWLSPSPVGPAGAFSGGPWATRARVSGCHPSRSCASARTAAAPPDPSRTAVVRRYRAAAGRRMAGSAEDQPRVRCTLGRRPRLAWRSIASRTGLVGMRRRLRHREGHQCDAAPPHTLHPRLTAPGRPALANGQTRALPGAARSDRGRNQ